MSTKIWVALLEVSWPRSWATPLRRGSVEVVRVDGKEMGPLGGTRREIMDATRMMATMTTGNRPGTLGGIGTMTAVDTRTAGETTGRGTGRGRRSCRTMMAEECIRGGNDYETTNCTGA